MDCLRLDCVVRIDCQSSAVPQERFASEQSRVNVVHHSDRDGVQQPTSQRQGRQRSRFSLIVAHFRLAVFWAQCQIPMFSVLLSVFKALLPLEKNNTPPLRPLQGFAS